MERYRSSFTLDEEIRREIGPLFWSQRRTLLHWIAAAGMGALALLVAFRQTYLYALFFLLFAARLVPSQGLRQWFCERIVGTRLYGALSFSRVESFFTEEGISIYDLTTGGQSMVYYQSIRQAAETEHYFLLRIKTGYWYTLVSKDCLTPEEQTAFMPFLQGECPKLKVI